MESLTLLTDLDSMRDDYILDIMAVIVDSNSASLIKNNKFILTVKVMDKTVDMNQVIAINMYAYSMRDLPLISAIGNILYLKNAKVQTWEGRK